MRFREVIKYVEQLIASGGGRGLPDYANIVIRDDLFDYFGTGSYVDSAPITPQNSEVWNLVSVWGRSAATDPENSGNIYLGIDVEGVLGEPYASGWGFATAAIPGSAQVTVEGKIPPGVKYSLAASGFDAYPVMAYEIPLTK